MSIPGKQIKNGIYEFSEMYQSDTRTKWQIMKDSFYNPKKQTILGRTKDEWGRTGLFYLVFFSVLAALFAICMKGLLLTLRDDEPKWKLDSSIIGTSPGMGFRPLPPNIVNDESIISYNSKNMTDIKLWIQRINTFLDSYHNSSLLPGGGRNQQICNHDTLLRPKHVCMFNPNQLGPCSYGGGYGFIFGWVPHYYNNPQELPNNMPESLKSHIETTKSSRNHVWVSCHSTNQKVNETLLESIKYYPDSQGFPGYYYPYENQLGYLSPLVAVQFIGFKKNEVIDVECQAWAKNIKNGNETEEKAYRVRFVLQVFV